MKRESLEAMGLTKDQIDEIMTANGADIEAAKGKDSARAEQAEQEAQSLRDQLAQRDQQLKDLQDASKTAEDLRAEVTRLQEVNATAAKEHAERMNAVRIDAAITAELAKAGARNSKAAAALLDRDAIKVDDKGEVQGLEDQIKTLKAAEDTSFIFAAPQEPKRVYKGAEPGQATDGAHKGKTKDDILGIKDPTERLAAIRQNMELFKS